MGMFKMNASTDLTSNTLSNNAVDKEEFKSGQPVLVDGPKISVLSISEQGSLIQYIKDPLSLS